MTDYEVAPSLTVDLCADCKGLWLDRGELARLADTDTDHPERREALAKARPSARRCTQCPTGPAMQTLPYSSREPVEMEFCPDCGGIFLDARELPRIQAAVNRDRQRQLGALRSQIAAKSRAQ